MVEKEDRVVNQEVIMYEFRMLLECYICPSYGATLQYYCLLFYLLLMLHSYALEREKRGAPSLGAASPTLLSQKLIT